MLTNLPKSIQGTTEVYDSKEAKGFKKADDFPIAWEIIFVNDRIGKEFTENLSNAIFDTPNDKAIFMGKMHSNSEKITCLECAFADKMTFSKVIREALDDILFYDESSQKILPKQMLIDDVEKLTVQKMAVAI